MKKYKYLFFDLDSTFWDVPANQRAAQQALYQEMEMERYFEGFDHYFNTFTKINAKLWLAYRDGFVQREELRNDRFVHLLSSVGISDQGIAIYMSNRYLQITPTFNTLVPHSLEVLEYLSSKNYPMALITNGFNEVQFDKVKYAGLSKYFERITTSEFAGVNKPNPGIFEFAMNKAGVKPTDAIMIGDDPYSDIYGAGSVGLDTIFFNPEALEHDQHPTFEIRSLLDIKDIL